jgi:hypothetical protein
MRRAEILMRSLRLFKRGILSFVPPRGMFWCHFHITMHKKAFHKLYACWRELLFGPKSAVLAKNVNFVISKKPAKGTKEHFSPRSAFNALFRWLNGRLSFEKRISQICLVTLSLITSQPSEHLFFKTDFLKPLVTKKCYLF